jgi:predicted transcriptional regulator of viral defense system
MVDSSRSAGQIDHSMGGKTVDEARLAELAAQQHSHLTTDQLRSCGCSKSATSRLVANGRLSRVHSGVYRIGGAVPTWIGSLHAAALATGGMGSHRAAAAVWELLPQPDSIDVIVGVGRRPRLGASRLTAATRFRGGSVGRGSL